MGKYSNMMKCAQVRSLVNEKQFKKALEIIEELNIEKINTITDLNIIAEVFKKFERFEDAKEIYLRLYDRVQTRRVIYQLIYLSVKCNNIEEAEEFYKEYMEIDDGSCDSLILRYYIDKAKGADRKILIKYLEELKKEDYIEEWAYELAKLYHKEGMEEECIRECTDIILWFGEGTIVEKATLLKLHYVDGADISSAKAIQETRNIAAELKMAAAIAEQNEKRKEEEGKRRKEIFTEIRSKREEKVQEEDVEDVWHPQQKEDLGETRKIDNLQNYIKQTKNFEKEEQTEDKIEESNEEKVEMKENLEERTEEEIEDSFMNEEKYKEQLSEVHKMLDHIREQQDSEDYNPEDYLDDPPEPDEDDELETVTVSEELAGTEPIISGKLAWLKGTMNIEKPKEPEDFGKPTWLEEKEDIEKSEGIGERIDSEKAAREEETAISEKIEEPKDTESEDWLNKTRNVQKAEQLENPKTSGKPDWLAETTNHEKSAGFGETIGADELERLKKAIGLDKIEESEKSTGEETIESQNILEMQEQEETDNQEYEPFIENAVSKEEQLLMNMVQEAKRQVKMPHFAMIGEDKTKIAELSKELAKELCRQQILPTSQIAKISAEKLNHIKLQDNQKKLTGGCLLIDDAHELSLESVQSLYQFLNRNKNGITIILTDTEKNMDWLMSRNRRLRKIIEFDLEI